jgi:tetratricopeptide (TPR) repeat protein
MNKFGQLALVCFTFSQTLHARPVDAGDAALQSRLASESAGKLRASKDFPAALRADQTAVRLQPENGNAWFDLGIDYVNLQRFDEAGYSFKRSLLAAPDDPVKWTGLCLSQYLAGDFDGAIHTCQEAARMDPKEADAWAWMGLGYARQDRWDASVRCLEIAAALGTRNGLAWYTLGIRYAREGRRTKVLEVYSRLQQLDPEAASMFYKVAVFPRERG